MQWKCDGFYNYIWLTWCMQVPAFTERCLQQVRKILFFRFFSKSMYVHTEVLYLWINSEVLKSELPSCHLLHPHVCVQLNNHEERQLLPESGRYIWCRSPSSFRCFITVLPCTVLPIYIKGVFQRKRTWVEFGSIDRPYTLCCGRRKYRQNLSVAHSMRDKNVFKN
jgi:hypothetical protein